MRVRIKSAPQYAQGGMAGNPNYGKQSNYGLDTSWYSYGGSNQQSNSMPLMPEVPEQFSNAELEKNEVVISQDKQGNPMTFNVGGDRHHSGGTPTILNEGDFVFSDTRKLKIKDEAVLKNFGKSKPMTPAQIAKQYNLKPYQQVLQDQNSDPIARQTAEMMTGNYMAKLNELAMVQEMQKGFPQGIPTLSDGVATGKFGGKYKCQYGGMPGYDPNKPTGVYSPETLQGQYPFQVLPYFPNQGVNVVNAPAGGAGEDIDYSGGKVAKITPTPQITQQPTTVPQVTPSAPKPDINIPVGQGNAKPGRKPPFQYTGADSMALMNAMQQLGSVKKYMPWESAPELQAPQYSQLSPEREIAAISEGTNSAMYAGMLTGNPQLNRALLSQLSGQQAQNVANTMSRYSNANVEIGNRQSDVDTQTRNQNAMMRGERANRLFDKSTIANQQYDNAIRSAQNNYVGANINAWNNRGDLYNMNVENPQYYIDPLTKKVVFKGNQTQLSGQVANEGATSEQMLTLFQKYKEQYPGASDSFIEKLVMKDLQQGQVSTSNGTVRTRGTGNLNNPTYYNGQYPYQPQ